MKKLIKRGAKMFCIKILVNVYKFDQVLDYFNTCFEKARVSDKLLVDAFILLTDNAKDIRCKIAFKIPTVGRL